MSASVSSSSPASYLRSLLPTVLRPPRHPREARRPHHSKPSSPSCVLPCLPPLLPACLGEQCLILDAAQVVDNCQLSDPTAPRLCPTSLLRLPCGRGAQLPAFCKWRRKPWFLHHWLATPQTRHLIRVAAGSPSGGHQLCLLVV